MAARRGRDSSRGAGWRCAGCSARESDVAWVVSSHKVRLSFSVLGTAGQRLTSYPESSRLCYSFKNCARGAPSLDLSLNHAITRNHSLYRLPLRAILQSNYNANRLERFTSNHLHTMFRRPGTGPSKASATTLCQKCLQRGHYSYECKARAQDRPYKSRPSRTQQLLNPRLAPALTTEVPSDLVRKKGVADDILKRKDEERLRESGRKRGRDESRTRRSESTDSVSTISTDAGRSRSPRRPVRSSGGEKGKRRGRSSSASGSERDAHRQRNARRRLSSFSPEVRGRRRGDREGSARSRDMDGHGKRARRASVERSRERSWSAERMDTADERSKRARSRERSASPRHRSPSPYSQRRAARRSPRPRSPSPRRERNGGRNRFDDVPPPAAKQAPPLPRAAPRERSLSPFSKRVALTRAMNGGQ